MNSKTLKPLNNMVLVKPRILNDKIILNDGKELYIDTTYEVEKHQNIICDVIEIPDKLFFTRKKSYTTMPWDIDIEIQPGDVAYCFYLAIQNAIENKYDSRCFIEDGEVYLLIRYDNIFMVLRGDQVIMCNGYVLVEGTKVEYRKEIQKLLDIGLTYPGNLESKGKTNYGIVRYIGAAPRMHLEKEFTSEGDLKVGDEVIFDNHADIPLEYEVHQTFMKGKDIYRIKRKDILAVIEK
jgi:co-chaperonin GroES (HSP10)